MTLIDLIIISLATYRAASIIAQEEIFAGLRNWAARERIARQADPRLRRQPSSVEDAEALAREREEASGWEMVPQPRRWFGQLISCVFCVSVWTGWALSTAWLYGGIVGQVFVVGLAASGGAISLGTWLANNAKRS